jgi:protein CpxP
MLSFIDPMARGAAAAALLGALALASPMGAAAAQSAGPAQLAQASPSPGAPATAPQQTPRRSPAERVEARIKRLHDRLKITPAQEPQWNAVAQVMRDNAQAMQQAIQQRQQARGLTAVDDLKAYEAIADAHAQGLQKLVPAFQALYQSMSDEQKKEADAYFSQARHRGRRTTSTQQKQQ